MAMAWFLLVTFLPLPPLLSSPFFIAFISVSTLLPAAGEYFREDFVLAGASFFSVVSISISPQESDGPFFPASCMRPFNSQWTSNRPGIIQGTDIWKLEFQAGLESRRGLIFQTYFYLKSSARRETTKYNKRNALQPHRRLACLPSKELK